MASCKQVEEMLLLSFIHGFISEEEFGVLHEALQTKNPIFRHSHYERFTLDTLEESEIFAEFRVRKRDIERLADALGLPESFVCHQRTRADKTEGLCMVLKRLVYPCRYSDLIHRFGRAVPELSMITNAVEEFIYPQYKYITRLNKVLNVNNITVPRFFFSFVFACLYLHVCIYTKSIKQSKCMYTPLSIVQSSVLVIWDLSISTHYLKIQ